MNPGRTSSTPSAPLLDCRQSAPAPVLATPVLATPVATVLAA